MVREEVGKREEITAQKTGEKKMWGRRDRLNSNNKRLSLGP